MRAGGQHVVLDDDRAFNTHDVKDKRRQYAGAVLARSAVKDQGVVRGVAQHSERPGKRLAPDVEIPHVPIGQVLIRGSG